MKHLFVNRAGRRAGEQGRSQIVVLALVVFVAGIAAGAFWLRHRASGQAGTASEPASAPVELSDGTKAVLSRLGAPVEIRFYSLLDKSTLSDSVVAYAHRVDELLSRYETEAHGKIKVIRRAESSTANAQAAAADGITSFNVDKGEACYLGLAVAQKNRRETLARLSPEWESALEPDLTRAIARLADSNEPPPPPTVAKAAEDAAEQVKRAVPNYQSLSLADGTKIIRDSGVNEFKQTATNLNARIKEAEKRVMEARNANSEAEQQAALKELNDLQARQKQALQDIAAKTSAEIDALERLKATNH